MLIHKDVSSSSRLRTHRLLGQVPVPGHVPGWRMSHQPGAKAPAAADGSAGCQAPARPGCTEPVLRGTLGGVLHVDVLNPRRSRARVPGASRVVGKGRRMLVSPTVQSCPHPQASHPSDSSDLQGPSSETPSRPGIYATASQPAPNGPAVLYNSIWHFVLLRGFRNCFDR